MALCKAFILRDMDQFLGRGSYPTCAGVRIEKIEVSNDRGE
jgi:hypothetical protein